MMDWNDAGPTWVGWLVMSLMMAAFWGAIVVVAVSLWRASGRAERPAGAGNESSRARQMLDERLARGEIDADDYDRRRELLSH